jgi:hypothetical protein
VAVVSESGNALLVTVDGVNVRFSRSIVEAPEELRKLRTAAQRLVNRPVGRKAKATRVKSTAVKSGGLGKAGSRFAASSLAQFNLVI